MIDSPLRLAVGDALRAAGARLAEIAADRWHVALGPPEAAPITACLADDWLVLDAEFRGPADAAALWDALRTNGDRAGNAKVVLVSTPSRPRLRAEIPLDLDGDVRSRVREALAGLGAAAAAPVAPSLRPPAVDLLHDSGWPATKRPDGRCVVALDVPGAFFQAAVDETEPAGLRLSVDLEAAEKPISAPCRTALVHLLLRAAGAVRLARPVVAADDQRPAARFEVLWREAPSASELAHSFAALSVACRLCGREAAALQRDETLARRYLDLAAGFEESATQPG